jgi:hypothetical protein
MKFRLPWKKIKYANQIQDGKYDYFRLRVGKLTYEMSIKREDGSLFYLLENELKYLPESVEDVENLIFEQIRNHLEQLKSEILEIESLKLVL